jgi:lipopolysaccharide transport system permease protein
MIQTLLIVAILHVQTSIPAPVFTYFGSLHWTLFASGISGAAESLIGHMGIVTRVRFPSDVLPAAAILSRVPDYAFGFLGLIPMVLVFGVRVGPGLLLLVPLIAIQLVFSAGIGMLLACANLFFRDIRHLLALALAIWFYLVPIIYPLENVPLQLRPFYLLNPLAVVIDSGRRATFPGVGGELDWASIAVAGVIAVATLWIGARVFARFQPRFAEAV